MKTSKKLAIFDLDGVLIDSLPNMRLALKQTSTNLKIKLKFKNYKKFIGLPFEDIMKNMGIKKNIPLIKKKYIFYSKKNLNKIRIKNKDFNSLKKLSKDYKLAVFTSKDKKRTKLILSKYKLFDIIVTSDDVKKGKPNPEGLKKILKFLNVDSKNATYVGDSYYDYKCAYNAKIKYIHAAWGYHKIKNYKKVKKIKNLQKIFKFI